MPLARGRRSQRAIDYWPGFVDALSTLLLTFMFLLSVFVLAQFLLSREISGKDEVLNRLNSQINELTQLLALEKSNTQDAQDQLANIQASLNAAEQEKSRLQKLLDQGSGSDAAANARIGTLTNDLESQRAANQRALSQVELLNQQIGALRKQIAALEDALNASEARDRESNTKIADLGRRLNVALAQRVQELNRYRSDFFGRLREILADRENIRIVGDRFVFQSEVLFPTGSDAINAEGQVEMKKVADAEHVEAAHAASATPAVLSELVADKGYHSNQTMIDLHGIGVRSYISEPDRGRRHWTTAPDAQRAVYGNRRRVNGVRGKRLLRRRGEYVERSFAHVYDTGGMRRTHLRGHRNILKRLLVHASAFNLGILMRQVFGHGTPRGLQGDPLAARLLELALAILTDRLWVATGALVAHVRLRPRLLRRHPGWAIA